MKRLMQLLCFLALVLFLAAPFLTQAAHHEGKKMTVLVGSPGV